MVASLLSTVREQLRESRVEHARRASLARELSSYHSDR